MQMFQHQQHAAGHYRIHNTFCHKSSVTAVCIGVDAYGQEPGAFDRCLPFPGLELCHLLPYGLQPFNGQLEPFGLIIVLLCYCCFLVLVDLPDLPSSDRVHIDIQRQVSHCTSSCANVAGLVVVADIAGYSRQVLCLNDLTHQVQSYDANLVMQHKHHATHL